MERVLCKSVAGVAQIASFDRRLQKQRDRKGGVGLYGRFCGSRNCGTARGRRAWVSRLEDKGITSSRSSSKSRRVFAIGIIGPGIDVCVDSSSGKVALRSDLLPTEDSVDAERGRLLERLNRYKMENEQEQKLMLEKDVAMKAMSTASKASTSIHTHLV